MANSSAKKLHKANKRRLNYLAAAILLPTLIYVIRWFFLSTPTSFHKIVLAILTVVHGLAFSLIWLSARPTYTKEGALIDAGDDVSKPGMFEYIHDIIYLTILIQLLLLFTRWALLLYSIVPIFAIYYSCFSGGSPFPDTVEEQDPVENFAGMSRKDRRKAERSARKQRS